MKVLTLLAQDGTTYTFESSLGIPITASDQIPVRISPKMDPILDYAVTAGSQTVLVTITSMGNPHCSTFWPGLDDAPADVLGPLLESHSLFPNRTNVEFIQVLDRHRIRVRFWERGVGRTLASGTGSCAAAVAAIDRVRIAVPFRHRELVVRQHDQRPGPLEPIRHRIDRHVEPSGVGHRPFDLIDRNLAQRAERLHEIELLRASPHGIDEVPQRIALGPLDLPASLEALPVHVQDRRIRFVQQQRIVREERQLVVRMVDVTRNHDLLVACQQVIFVRPDQIVVGALILRAVFRVGGQVERDAEVRQDVQRAKARFVRILPDRVRPPPSPTGARPVNVDELIRLINAETTILPVIPDYVPDDFSGDRTSSLIPATELAPPPRTKGKPKHSALAVATKTWKRRFLRGAVIAVLSTLAGGAAVAMAMNKSVTVTVDGEQIIVQSLRPGRRTRGFLAVGIARRPTPEQRTVLSTAVSLLTLMFAQATALRSA